MNAGRFYEVTDGKGKFWELPLGSDHKITVRPAADALEAALKDIAGLREALEPFAAVYEYDDVGRHFPEAIYQRKGLRLHLVSDDFARARAALASHGGVSPAAEAG